MTNRWLILAIICIALSLSGCTGSFSLPQNPFASQPTPTPTPVAPPELVTVLNANYISDTIPVSMTPGQRYNITLNMYNNGGVLWSNSGNTKLVALPVSENDALLFGDSAFIMGPGIIVNYGYTYSWNFSITAPKRNGNYTLIYRMVNGDNTPFGDIIIKNVTVGAPGSDVVFTSSQVKYYPPLTQGLTIQRGAWQNVSITVKNMGRYDWSQENKTYLAVVDYEPNDAVKFCPETLFHIAPESVYTYGDQCFWRLKLQAPSYPGTYHLKYRMQKDGQWFGSTLDVAVTVT